jgi:hypothetical protein
MQGPMIQKHRETMHKIHFGLCPFQSTPRHNPLSHSDESPLHLHSPCNPTSTCVTYWSEVCTNGTQFTEKNIRSIQPNTRLHANPTEHLTQTGQTAKRTFFMCPYLVHEVDIPILDRTVGIVFKIYMMANLSRKHGRAA